MQEIPSASKLVARLCLVRHGETEWNAERRIQGQIDIGLNAIGCRQAELAGQWLKDAGIAAIYSSDLQRAWTTAGYIGAALGLEPLATPELRERRYGIFEGLTYDEAKSQYPEAFSSMERRDPDFDLGTGESLRTLFGRVTEKLRHLSAAHVGQSVVVVVHGGVLDIVNRFVRGNPLETPRDFLIPNAGLNWIAWNGSDWSIESWGETAHLASDTLDELPA